MQPTKSHFLFVNGIMVHPIPNQCNTVSSNNGDSGLVPDDSFLPHRSAVRRACSSSPTRAQTAISDQTQSYMVYYYTQGCPQEQTCLMYPQESDSTQQAGAHDSGGDAPLLLFLPPLEYIYSLSVQCNLASLRDENALRTTVLQEHSDQNTESCHLVYHTISFPPSRLIGSLSHTQAE